MAGPCGNNARQQRQACRVPGSHSIPAHDPIQCRQKSEHQSDCREAIQRQCQRANLDDVVRVQGTLPIMTDINDVVIAVSSRKAFPIVQGGNVAMTATFI